MVAADIATAIRTIRAPTSHGRDSIASSSRAVAAASEDLGEFNEEIVASRDFSPAMPGSGADRPHEVDFPPLAILSPTRVRQHRAQPRKFIVPDFAEVNRRIDELGGCLQRCLRNFLHHQQTCFPILVRARVVTRSGKTCARRRNSNGILPEGTRDAAVRQSDRRCRARLATFAMLDQVAQPATGIDRAPERIRGSTKKRFRTLAPRSRRIQARQLGARARRNFACARA